ncbi:MAG: FUSC family protein, partial [Xanthobacteraceae bacterium]
MFEVAVGGVVAIAVSLLVLPARAHALGTYAAVHALEHMARVLPAVIAGFLTRRDPRENVRHQDDVGESVHAFAQ